VTSPVRRGTLVDVNDPTVTPPALVRQPALVYPDLARQARVEGIVELKALIDENGSVVEEVLVRCSRPNYRFESEAERHVRGRRYQPARKDGVAVRVWLPIVVNFRLAR
jgi:protein TonB